MLALILATKAEAPPAQHCKSTLIVVPLSILSNWETQIQDHCHPGSLSTMVYYGMNRDKVEADDLSKYDVVITTYQVVAGEADDGMKTQTGKKKKKNARSLFEVKWKVVRAYYRDP